MEENEILEAAWMSGSSYAETQRRFEEQEEWMAQDAEFRREMDEWLDSVMPLLEMDATRVEPAIRYY